MTAERPKSSAETARAYHARGWAVVPVPFQEKGPRLPEWTTYEFDPAHADEEFTEPSNIGVILGVRSGGLADVDLDCIEAIQVADVFLQATLTFGRDSRRASHRLYKSPGAPYRKHTEPARAKDEKAQTIVELRAGSGKQTVFPGSVHPSGEHIEFDNPDAVIAEMSGPDLLRAVEQVAAAALLMRQGVGLADAVARVKGGDLSILSQRKGDRSTSFKKIAAADISSWGAESVNARSKFNADHPLDGPRAGGTCPACMHHECYGVHDAKWTCFSASHGESPCGRADPRGHFFGDALDLEAHVAGCSPQQLLEREGYLDSLRLTEAGLAERFARMHSAKVRYVPSRNVWLVWDGRRWEPDQRNSILPLVKQTVRSLCDDAKNEEDEELRPKILKFAARGESRSVLESVARLAQSERALVVTSDELDSDPWLMTVNNGTIDLKTGSLHAHDPADLITKLAPVDFDADAVCTTWNKVILQAMCGDASLVSFLQRALGSAMTGAIREHVLFFFHGKGGNGKTLTLEVFLTLYGDYGLQAAPDLLLAQDHGTRHLTEQAALRGARIAVCSEVDEGRRLAGATVKRLTGGERITANKMHKDHETFEPTHKLFLSANDKPAVSGTDEAIWRRILQVPFRLVVPKHEQDPDLKTKLLREAPGILQWALRGCLEWQMIGLQPPPAVTEATRAYRAEQDRFADFVSECCCFEEGEGPSIAEMSNAYAAWCARNRDHSSLPRHAFNERLEAQGATRGKDAGGNMRLWRGIKLQSQSMPGSGQPGRPVPFSSHRDSLRENKGGPDVSVVRTAGDGSRTENPGMLRRHRTKGSTR